MDLGWACEGKEIGRGPLADGRSGLSGTVVTTLRAAVLALGRRCGGWNGRRRFWGKSRISAIWGFPGPAGITGSR
ncbi:hypothetical protein CRG98_008679 [Punica granatum]|uniref:Uncharacterized protein n=1 Tax=Punica granatum TaxID=22663 RepID=A0A2I0KSX8_PUNGR|nr:hypothetical protein CRG98_008679 [Punica granatum]